MHATHVNQLVAKNMHRKKLYDARGVRRGNTVIGIWKAQAFWIMMQFFLHSAQFSLNVDVGNGSVINIHGDVKNLKG